MDSSSSLDRADTPLQYIVNGAKKWITNGSFADYCCAAVRTGGPGHNGVSALVIPMKVEGVTCRKIENSGVAASGKSTKGSPSTLQDANSKTSFHVH